MPTAKVTKNVSAATGGGNVLCSTLISIKTKAWLYSFGLMMAVTLGSAVVSCDSILDEDDVDCSVEYRVKFKYDYNMKYADAFSREVSSVALYAFDDNGKLVYQKTEAGDVLAVDGYSMAVDMEPGDYHLITWAGLSDEASFSVPLITQGVSSLEELQCKMDRIYSRAADGSAVVSSKLSSLWHGEVTKQSFTRAATRQVVTVPLVKNTNTIRVILQQMDGVTVDVDKFEFTITDDNGLMNYNNKLISDETLTYYPYYRAQGGTVAGKSARAEGDAAAAEDDNISVAIAQITVGRLVEENNPKLTITNTETGETVLSIPLVKYLLLTEAEGHDMTNQEYLDRQDEYNMTFFLDESMKWINTRIIINDWVVRFNDMNM